MTRIGDFSHHFKPEITSAGVKIGRYGTYSIKEVPKNLNRHFDAVEKMSHTMKNLGRAKARPSTQGGVSLNRQEMEKLRKAHRKGGQHPQSTQVKNIALKLAVSEEQARNLLEADTLEDAVRSFEYHSRISPKLIGQMRKTWFEDPVQAASAKIFNKTPQEMTSVSPNEIMALKHMVSQFSVEQIKFFLKAHIQALPLEYLTDQQLQALSPKQKSFLLPEQIKKLPPEKRALIES